MAKEKIDIKSKIKSIEFSLGFLQTIDCTNEENKKYAKMVENGEQLPDGVHRYKYENGDAYGFYTIYEPELTEEEKQKYIILKQYETLTTIKKCVVFFVALTVIALVLGVLSALI